LIESVTEMFEKNMIFSKAQRWRWRSNNCQTRYLSVIFPENRRS